MRMTRRLAVVIAVVCGLLAATLTTLFLFGLQREQQQEIAQVSVVTPVETIPAGTVIQKDMVEVQKIPEDEKPAEAASKLAHVVGDVAVADLAPGQPIMAVHLASRTGGADLSLVVPEGMRAVTVALDPIIGVAGFLQPGDRVDVIGVFAIEEATVTCTVLQNVQLLALGRETIVSKERAIGETQEEEPKAAKAEARTTATLAVALQDAQKLIITAARGTIRLALRRRGEEEYSRVKPTDLTNVVGPEFFTKEAEEEGPPPEERVETAPTEPEPTVAVAPTGEARRPAVEVIRGSEREIVIP